MTTTTTAGTTRTRPPREEAEARRGSTTRLSRLRRMIAGRMSESLRVSAQLTAVQEADLTAVSEIRDGVKARFREEEGASLTHLAFIAHATVAALAEFPRLNATIDESVTRVVHHPAVHLGIAVDTPRGLMVPVLRDADGLDVGQLAVRIATLAGRVRDGSITADELTGSTFTLTNIGSAGSLLDTPIINQPEVAILGTGAIRRLPRIVTGPDGEEGIAVRSVCYLPLTYDHRLVDGALAGRFLASVRTRLERTDWTAHLPAYADAST
ncbi:hypothetical protein CJD44_00940 [Streptomyces sp. alain-838]|nr:2-oxo acid dehydrogenase subunit E2 [Streptomyces sp. alain-838]PAK28041.1 hypothetical protein CJD44_00940 [Streptomyces sp. alain-838]